MRIIRIWLGESLYRPQPRDKRGRGRRHRRRRTIRRRRHRQLIPLKTGAVADVEPPALTRVSTSMTTASRLARPACLWLALVAAGAPAPTGAATVPEADPAEALPGGAATNRRRFGPDAFSEPSANLRFEHRRRFFLGNGLFHRVWTEADGLGPLFNAVTCHRCHARDGRGRPVEADGAAGVALVPRLGAPHPVYGAQLQPLAVDGVPPEARIALRFEERPVTLADGRVVTLRRPRYLPIAPGYGPLDDTVVIAPRVAPPMIGLGLLEAVAAADVTRRADPDDADGDGVSGRPNRVFSRAEGRIMLGRFGWKAAEPTVVDQAAAALALDMGLSTPLRPDAAGDCTASQSACRAAGHGGGPEITAETLELIAFYSRQLAVPARRGADDRQVLRGRALFHASGCAACHTPAHRTRADWPLAALAGQVIRPYTDLLLHDMGEALADGRAEGLATGREWRTPPLWGIGLTETVSGHTFFLHDGRARNLLEAILWHDGEARDAREAVRAMSSGDREALLAFLGSL